MSQQRKDLIADGMVKFLSFQEQGRMNFATFSNPVHDQSFFNSKFARCIHKDEIGNMRNFVTERLGELWLEKSGDKDRNDLEIGVTDMYAILPSFMLDAFPLTLVRQCSGTYIQRASASSKIVIRGADAACRSALFMVLVCACQKVSRRHQSEIAITVKLMQYMPRSLGGRVSAPAHAANEITVRGSASDCITEALRMSIDLVQWQRPETFGGVVRDTERRIRICDNTAAAVIGARGSQIKEIRNVCNAEVKLDHDCDARGHRTVTITGNVCAAKAAEFLVRYFDDPATQSRTRAGGTLLKMYI